MSHGHVFCKNPFFSGVYKKLKRGKIKTFFPPPLSTWNLQETRCCCNNRWSSPLAHAYNAVGNKMTWKMQKTNIFFNTHMVKFPSCQLLLLEARRRTLRRNVKRTTQVRTHGMPVSLLFKPWHGWCYDLRTVCLGSGGVDVPPQGPRQQQQQGHVPYRLPLGRSIRAAWEGFFFSFALFANKSLVVFAIHPGSVPGVVWKNKKGKILTDTIFPLLTSLTIACLCHTPRCCLLCVQVLCCSDPSTEKKEQNKNWAQNRHHHPSVMSF